MDVLLNQKDYRDTYQVYGKKDPHRGYGGNFIQWIFILDAEPYDSWGNGSAMRVSPVGYFFETLEEVILEARKSAEVSHNHPEGFKGAQATASAVFLARTGSTKQEIKDYIEGTFGYDLSRKLDDIRPDYQFDVSCQGSVPEAIIAFLESKDFESAIRLAISIGGDSDTIACITGGIAEAFYGEIPDEIVRKVKNILPDEFVDVIEQFTTLVGSE